jgi:integrase
VAETGAPGGDHLAVVSPASDAMLTAPEADVGVAVELATPPWQPGAGGTERERLARLEAIAGRYVASQRPANTLRAYAADWKVWEDYIAAAQIPLLSGTAGALVGFVWWLETTKQAAPATIDRRLTGAVVGLRQLHAHLEPRAALAARQALSGYRRRLAEAGITRGRGQARPITVPELRTVSLSCPDTLAGRRDRALLLLGFAIASRCSDLANLLVTDIAPDPKGLCVTVRFGKAIGTSPIEYGHHLATCAVRAWTAWTTAAAITAGPAFRRVDRHNRLLRDGLSPQAVDQALLRAGRRANLPYPLTAHSLRSGLATEARRAGKRDDVIAAQGRWQPGSRALHRYFRQVDRWTDNALTDLGL